MNLRYLVTAAALAAVIPSAAGAQDAQTCQRVTDAEVASLFERWNASLATLDPAKVTANYAPDAVLLPTVSNTPRTDPAAIQDYFVHFLEKHPQGTIDTRTIKIGCNIAYDMGTYTFDVVGADGAHAKVPARYSYVYVFRDGQWLIAHHHSSAMPEPVATH